MPAYEVEHIDPLTPLQKDELAKAITHIHSHLFTTPSMFVNVRFVNLDGQDYYVGGRKHRFNPINRILAHVRPGGGRSTSMFNQLCDEIYAAWKRIVVVGEDGERELRAIFVLGTIIAGSEAGFALPPAGEDKKWLKDNAVAFREKADAGDAEFKELMRELQTRDDLKGIVE